MHQPPTQYVVIETKTGTLDVTGTLSEPMTPSELEYHLVLFKERPKEKKESASLCAHICLPSLCVTASVFRSVNCKMDHMWRRDERNKEKKDTRMSKT